MAILHFPIRRCLACMLTMLAAAHALAEEAVEHAGTVKRGTLRREHDAWVFRRTDNTLVPASNIAFIRFAQGGFPTPRVMISHTILLAGGQRVTGKFIRGDTKTITFMPSWGGTVSLNRDVVDGIEQADSSLLTARETLTKPSRELLIVGTPSTDAGGLRLDNASHGLTRSWSPPLRDGSVRLLLRTSAAQGGMGWMIETIGIDSRPGLRLDAGNWRSANCKSPYPGLPASAEWRLLTFEIRDHRLRIFLDAHCLGETPITEKDGIVGVRVHAEMSRQATKPFEIWLSEMRVTRRVPSVSDPGLDADRDIVQLEHGEQLFGRVTDADGDAIRFDAKFGNRILAWTNVRGIFFASRSKTPVRLAAVLTYRPAPGFPVDSLRCDLLRWENANLVVKHQSLGELSLTRSQLHTLQMSAK